MIDPFARYPLPWRVADFDGRVVILAADGAKVTEVSPGQHGRKPPKRGEAREIAEMIVEMVNCPVQAAIVDFRGLPWGGRIVIPSAVVARCGELEDGA